MEIKSYNCFWVYQNKTFSDEANGAFLWSPQFTKDGKHHPGYDLMRQVRKGDLIFHSIDRAIVAISRAKKDCFAFKNPGPAFTIWDKEGWRIDVEIFYPETPWIYSKTQGKEMYKLLPTNGPFCSNGWGQERYLCSVNTPLFEYLVDKVLGAQTTEQARTDILDFLDYKPYIILSEIEDGCKVKANLLEQSKEVELTIDANKIPNHKNWLGKKVGDVLKVPGVNLSYRVERIYREES